MDTIAKRLEEYNDAVSKRKNCTSKLQRANKNRPREVSSKRPEPMKIPKGNKNTTFQARDPRFDSLCGEYDAISFKRDYSFIDDIRVQEIMKLKKELSKANDLEEKKRIKAVLQRLKNKEREENKLKERIKKRTEKREEHLRNIKEGKKIHFRSKFENKLANLMDKYNELKKTGKLKKHIERQRKKIRRKDKQHSLFN